MRLDGYDTQQVCLNGHQANSSLYSNPELSKKFCRQCGEPTIHQCPSCSANIKGYLHVPGVVSVRQVAVPQRCDNCGSKFPWTDAVAAARGKSAVEALPTDFLVTQLCSRFPLVVQQLRRRHDTRETLDVADEYDVQDVLHSLLHLFFDDVRPEEVVPSYAAKSTRMDFLLKKESVVIEAKMTRKGLQAKEVGEQLILDIAYYQAHHDCKSLYCLVYDPERRIANPRGLEGDLGKVHGTLAVKVFVVS